MIYALDADGFFLTSGGEVKTMNHETIQLDGRELDVAFDYYAGDPSVGLRHEYHIYGVFEDCVPIFWGGIEDDIIQGLEGVRNEIKI